VKWGRLSQKVWRKGVSGGMVRGKRGFGLLLAAVSRNLCYTFANNLPLLNVAPAFFCGLYLQKSSRTLKFDDFVYKTLLEKRFQD